MIIVLYIRITLPTSGFDLLIILRGEKSKIP